DRICGILFPWAKQRFGAGDAQRVITTCPAATAPRIEEIKPAVPADDERSFDNSSFPGGIVAQDFLWLTYQFDSIIGQLLRPENRGQFATIAVFFPNEVALAIFIVERHRIDRARGLRDEWAMIGIGTRGLVR